MSAFGRDNLTHERWTPQSGVLLLLRKPATGFCFEFANSGRSEKGNVPLFPNVAVKANA